MNRLHRKEFYWTISNDDNRAEDGRKLRTRFCAETGYADMDFLYGPCSVLEMIIGLSIRIENDIVWDYEKPDRTRDWFWMMIDNLGFGDCRDALYDADMDEYVSYRIDILLDRRYERNGQGGLFPLNDPLEKDQRDVEIWDQMAEFLCENNIV